MTVTEKKIRTITLHPEGVEYLDEDNPQIAELRYRQFFGRGENRYLIYPSYWPRGWGIPPLLGVVQADNEFLAERLAYDRGILSPHNCTFQPKFKLITKENQS